MQRIFCVRYSMDARYVLSASDDGNVRLWKADASAKLGVMAPREQVAADYRKAVKERFKHMPEVRRIDKQRHKPRAINVAARQQTEQRAAERRREENAAKNSGGKPPVPASKRSIVTVQK
ncbi:hypothetical protein HK405_011997 [Cladochytrium tenue]|nr:hypothetical protein HK405_011997 [Cladochytrium tenue]